MYYLYANVYTQAGLLPQPFIRENQTFGSSVAMNSEGMSTAELNTTLARQYNLSFGFETYWARNCSMQERFWW